MPLVGQEDSGRRKWYVLPMAKAVRRRELLGLVGGAAVWPLTSSAQQRGPQVVGYLSARSPDDELSPILGDDLMDQAAAVWA